METVQRANIDGPVPHSGRFSGDDVMAAVTTVLQQQQNRRLLVYIHVPFCSSKCHFCDWVAHVPTRDLTDTDGSLRQSYVNALCRQVHFYGPKLTDAGYRLTNVYWGGGTPTQLLPAQLAQIASAIAETFCLDDIREHTLEASPETLSRKHIEALAPYGMGRISVGVQSFDKDILRRMGRAHDPEGARAAIQSIRDSGITNFNIDLIVDYPGQSFQQQMDAVRCAIDLKVPHVSVYAFRPSNQELVIVRQVKSGKRDGTSMLEGERRRVHAAVADIFEKAGYREDAYGYFCTDAGRFEADLYYFGYLGDWFGFGAGAHSHVGRHLVKHTDDTRRGGNPQIRGFIDDPISMAVLQPKWLLPPKYFVSSRGPARLSFLSPYGIRYDRWQDQFGVDFRELRKSASVAAFVDELALRHWDLQDDKIGLYAPEGWRMSQRRVASPSMDVAEG